MLKEYRPDIDGLRALAVIPVIFFHFQRFGCTGGFVGVDVFFVISGFLITSILARELGAGTYSMLAFYERRVRRIVPALFLMFAATFLAAWVVLLPRHMESFGASLLAALPLTANVYFWVDSGYFADASNLKPLLHVWSLAIEEQFYLLFPWLLAWALRRGQGVARGVVALAALLSFAAGWAMLRYQPDAAFYLAPFRAWELLLGALLGLGSVPRLASPALRNVVAALGLLAILYSVFAFDQHTRFPGPAALLPCLGAAFVIHAGSSGHSWVGRLLSLKVLVAIGLASYSLYLWHWPLVVFVRHGLIGVFRPAHTTKLLWITPLLGFASWYFVERPLRRRGTRTQIFTGAAIAGALLAAGGAAAVLTHGFDFRVVQRSQLTHVDRLTTRQFLNGYCRGDAPLYGERRSDLCRLGPDDGTPSFLIWGDSHAQGITPQLEELAKAEGRSGVIALGPGCAPLLTNVQGPCATRGVREALGDPQIRNVILHARWAASGDGVAARGELSPAALRRGLEATLSAAHQFGRRVSVIGPVPEPVGHVPDAVARALWLGSAADVRPTLAGFQARQQKVLPMLRELQRQYGFALEYPHQVLCRSTHCDIVRDGQVLYTDDHHLSIEGVALLRDMLARALELPAPATP